jgi:hypothetical protein
MKIRILLIIGWLICINGNTQPPETTYLGNVAKSGYENDAYYGPFDIGFSFVFFGNSYTQFYVSSNGLVSFGTGSSDGSPDPIPTAGAPNNMIAAFWDDLTVSYTGKILYTTIGAAPNRKLIVQSLNMNFYNIPALFGTFSVILYETTNIIQVQFRLIVDNVSTRSHGSTATIGIENATGTAGVQYSYLNPTAISNEQAISFSPSVSTYTINSDAVYDGVYLTSNLNLPEPGITTLQSPAPNAAIGANQTFEWAAASYAESYTLYISNRPDLTDATTYYAGSNLSYAITGLTLDATYYWGVFATNATGTTWCEIKKFTTSSTPPLAGIPLTIWIAQGDEREIKLQYTGGDASAKTAIVTSLPAQGQLWQVSGGVKSTQIQITDLPATVSDPQYSLIYVASGSTGNGAGNFNFMFHDDTFDSTEATITINVSVAGIPNFLNASRNANVEVQFDRKMNDPTDKHNQFTVTVDGSPVTISSASLKTGDPYAIVLTLASSLTGSEVVLVSYIQGNVSATTGGLLASFTDQPVTLTAQTIIFIQSLDKKYSDSPFTLTATASSGLGMTYSSSNPGVATISGNIATFHAPGSSDVTARQAGNGTYAPARYIKTLTISKGDQTITFDALPTKTVGDPDFDAGSTASSTLPVSYSSDNLAVATIVGGLIHIVDAGTANITASQSGNENYNAAEDVMQPLTVDIPTGLENPVISLNSFNIYSASGMIWIRTLSEEWDGKTGSVKVYDIIGKPVINLLPVDFQKNSLIQINSPEIRGIYIVLIKAGRLKYTGKVVVR